MDEKLVERELLREELYCRIKYEVGRKLAPRLKAKEIANILLRYVFNQIRGIETSVTTTDPVFVVSRNREGDAYAQIVKDLLYHKFSNYEATTYATFIVQSFADAAQDMVKFEKTLRRDNIATIGIDDRKCHIIKYQAREWLDISDLAVKNPQFARHALALQIRYEYLELNNHGLALPYELLGFKKGDFPIAERLGASTITLFRIWKQSLVQKEISLVSLMMHHLRMMHQGKRQKQFRSIVPLMKV